jgi:hypothetical protein
MRWSIKTNQRKPWSQIFFYGDFEHSLTEVIAGDYRAVLDSVRLAPSARFGQPWLILKDTKFPTFHFYVRDTAEGVGALTQFRRLDLGIIAAHFDLVRLQLQLNGRWNFEAPATSVPSDVKYRFSFIGIN